MASVDGLKILKRKFLNDISKYLKNWFNEENGMFVCGVKKKIFFGFKNVS